MAEHQMENIAAWAEGLATSQPSALFVSAEHALVWAADTLRRRRHARLSPLWQQVEAGTGKPSTDEEGIPLAIPEKLPEPEHLLPSPQDRLATALTIEQAVENLGEGGRLLRLHAWGDWHTNAALTAALRNQEAMRQKGERLRLNLRYSYRQLGILLHADHKTIARHIRLALNDLADALEAKGLLYVPGRPITPV